MNWLENDLLVADSIGQAYLKSNVFELLESSKGKKNVACPSPYKWKHFSY